MTARRGALLLGLAILALGWTGPLPSLAATSFSAHMLLHVMVVAVAPPLLALGLASGTPDNWQGLLGRLPPLLAAVLELVVVWAWHAPALHHLARQQGWALALEQASFLAVGLLLWCAALNERRQAARNQAAQGIAALLMTSTHMTLLGVLLSAAPRVLYAGHGRESGWSGLEPLADQQLGGVIMLAVAGTSYLCGGLFLLFRLLYDGPPPVTGKVASGPVPPHGEK